MPIMRFPISFGLLVASVICLPMLTSCLSREDQAWYMLPQGNLVEGQNKTWEIIDETSFPGLVAEGDAYEIVAQFDALVRKITNGRVSAAMDLTLAEEFSSKQAFFVLQDRLRERKRLELKVQRTNDAALAVAHELKLYRYMSEGRIYFVPREFRSLYNEANRNFPFDANERISFSQAISFMALATSREDFRKFEIPDEVISRKLFDPDSTFSRAELTSLNLLGAIRIMRTRLNCKVELVEEDRLIFKKITDEPDVPKPGG